MSLPMRSLSLEEAELLVGKHPGFEAFWESYDLIIWKPKADAYMRMSGMLRDGKWGTAFRVRPDDNGRYSVLEKYTTPLDGRLRAARTR